jgi:hypothetical protein
MKMKKTNMLDIPKDVAEIINTPLWRIRYVAAREDPKLFIKYFLPSAWPVASKYPKQIQFLRESLSAQEGILRAGSRSGKTYTISILIIYLLFYRPRPKGSYFYGNYDKTYQILNAAMTLNQSKLVMNNVLEMLNKSPFFKEIDFIKETRGGQSPELVTCLNSRLDVRPTVHGGRHILGEYYDFINIDEAASEPDLNHLLIKTIGSRRADVNGRLFMTSTPQGATTFREVWFNLAEKKKKGKPVVLGRFEAYDNPVNDHDFLDNLKENMTQGQIQEEIYGRFADFSNTFFNIRDVLEAFKRGAEHNARIFIPLDDPTSGKCLTETNNTNVPYMVRAMAGKKYFTGVDTAGHGEDYSVLITMEINGQYRTVVAYERINKVGTLGQAGVVERIKRRLTQYPGPCYFDASSLGGQMLKEVLENELPNHLVEYCVGVSSVKRPGRSEHNNKRHMLTDLNIAFEQQSIVIPDDLRLKALRSELTYYQYEDKTFHQDTVMALALCNYAYVEYVDTDPDFGAILNNLY